MRVYWIDTGVLVQNRRTFHRRERVPQFWHWLSDQIDAGRVMMPERVYAEVIKGTDWLVPWVRARREKGLCVYPDAATQARYTVIADYVEGPTKYRDGHQKDKALRGADLWVIAHAQGNKNHIVVSQEERGNPGDNRVKIPSVCDAMKVQCCNTFKMMEHLKARFG